MTDARGSCAVCGVHVGRWRGGRRRGDDGNTGVESGSHSTESLASFMGRVLTVFREVRSLKVFEEERMATSAFRTIILAAI